MNTTILKKYCYFWIAAILFTVSAQAQQKGTDRFQPIWKLPELKEKAAEQAEKKSASGTAADALSASLAYNGSMVWMMEQLETTYYPKGRFGEGIKASVQRISQELSKLSAEINLRDGNDENVKRVAATMRVGDFLEEMIQDMVFNITFNQPDFNFDKWKQAWDGGDDNSAAPQPQPAPQPKK